MNLGPELFFGGTLCEIKTVQAALDQGVGYVVVVGLSTLFALGMFAHQPAHGSNIVADADDSKGMILVTFILRRYNSELQTSEMFDTAGRTVKSGLVGSAVVLYAPSLEI